MAAETELERMVVRLVGDSQSYLQMLNQAQTATMQTAKSVEQSAGRIEGFGMSLGKLGVVASAAFAAVGVAVGGVATAVKGVQLAAEAEKTEIAFSTMLQSAEKGQALVKMLQEFAAKTPLATSEIQSAAKTLLQFGIAGNDLLPIMRMLGDVTGGSAFEFQNIARVMGQVASQNRLMGNDVFQFINAGWNPLNEISKKLGKSMAELRGGR